jgi:hypothetical protein
MTSGSFFCPVCRNAMLWADADVAHTGSFCSEACARTYAAGQHEPAAAADLQHAAEDGSDPGAWRHQHGESDPQQPALFA